MFSRGASGKVNDEMAWCVIKNNEIFVALNVFVVVVVDDDDDDRRLVMELCGRGNLAKLMSNLPVGKSLLFAPCDMLSPER